MATSETSLDVLSKAAALVNTTMTVIYDSNGARMSPAKDLPTKGQKVKRSRSRRSLPGGANIPLEKTLEKMREKNGSPTRSASTSEPKKTDSGVLSFAYIFPKRDSEESLYLAQSTPTLFPPPPPYPRPAPSSSPPKTISFGNAYREPFYKSDSPMRGAEMSNSADEDDMPLDMSTKSVLRNETLQHRPSVITCASALRRTQCQHQDASDDQEGGKGLEATSPLSKGQGEDDSDSDESRDSKPGHRREIISGMCDPVIDEHFRRSLGKDYSEIFSSTTNSNSVSVTVDDHFAKALGDTWLRLQQPNSKERSTVTSNNSTRSPVVKHVPGLITL